MKVPKTTDKTKLKLKIMERISIKRLFPQESNLVNQVLARDIDKKISFDQKEMKDIEMKAVGDKMIWDAEKDKGKFVEFSDAEIEFLKKQIDEMDKKNKVTAEMVDVIMKIKDVKGEK